MMRAIQVAATGDSSVLKLVSIAMPSVQANQILIRVHASGVNFIDTYHRTGLYKLPLPFIPGREGSGVVEETSVSYPNFKKGDRVCFQSASTYAEFAAVDVGKVIRLPDNVSFETGAAVLLQGMTALAMTRLVHHVKEGETILIHAAAGGTGLLLTQVCKLVGATVIGTTSTEEKKNIALQAGADHVILYKEESIKDRVMEITKNKGVAAVFDGVGKTTFDTSLSCLATLGSMVSFGNASGKVDDIDIMKLVPNAIRLSRPSLFQLVKTNEDFTFFANELLDLLQKEKLKFHVSKTYKLEDAALAHDDLEGQKTTGKLVLDCTA